jgi:hypothetical protein
MEKRRNIKKNKQVSEIFKTMGTLMPAKKKKKREMNKIAHVCMQSCFPSSKRDICFQGA